MNRSHHLLGSTALCVALWAAGVPALAQAQAQSPGVLDEVVVTASRREESVQKAAASVTAISATRLAESGITEARQLQQVAPSLVVSVGQSESVASQFRLRGIGTSGAQVGFEGSVGVYLDGAYITRGGIATSDLLDVKRVEVVRGAQGTLYGKNTSAGVITIFSNEPTFDWSGYLFGSVGNLNARRVEGAVGGPIVDDRLAFRIAGAYSVRDGYVKNYDGREFNDRNRYMLRGQLLWAPTDATSLRLIADYAEKDEACCQTIQSISSAATATISRIPGAIMAPLNGYSSTVDADLASGIKQTGFTALFDHDLGWANLKVVGSTRSFKSHDNTDGDGTVFDIAPIKDLVIDDQTSSLEVQLAGSTDRVDWLLGVYGFKSDVSTSQRQVFGVDAGRFYAALTGANPAFYPVGAGDQRFSFNQSGSGESVFTHNIIKLTDDLKLTVGARYLVEEKKGYGFTLSDGNRIYTATDVLPARCRAPTPPGVARALCPVNPTGGDFDDQAATGTIGLSYQVTPDHLVFGNISSGYKAGGINAARDARGAPPVNPALVNGTFKPEKVVSYEAGVKTQWLDHRLTVNATAFYMTFEDLQLQIRDIVTNAFNVTNAGSAVSRGVEVETYIQPIQDLNLGASVAYIDAQYGSDVADASLRNRQIGNAPKWTVQANASWGHDLTADWRLLVSGNARYVSAYNANSALLPGNVQKAFTVANARIGVRNEPLDLTVGLWVNNIGDTYYASLRSGLPNQTGAHGLFVAEPRTYGVDIRKAF